MTTRLTILGGTDFSNGEVLYGTDLNDTLAGLDGSLGEVKMFALSMSGSTTKAALQTRGWAICDGTTPATQGISTPTISTTPDLQESFIKMSSDESSGGTGGDTQHNHGATLTHVEGGGSEWPGGSGFQYNSHTIPNDDHLPTYYEVAFFMKVKL